LAETYLLRIEGMDFAATLDDTQDLSCIRGAGLALLGAADAVSPFLQQSDIGFDPARDTLLKGASQAAFRVRASSPAAANDLRDAVAGHLAAGCPRNGTPTLTPTRHLSFAVDIVPGDDLQAYRRAFAANRVRQLDTTHWPLPRFSPEVEGPGVTGDVIRPADARYRAPASRIIGESDDAESPATATFAVSTSFRDRNAFGRQARRGFYSKARTGLDLRNVSFAQSFEDIVADPPPRLPASVQRKIAVFYADGNAFGQIAEQQSNMAALGAFSKHLVALQSTLLQAILRDMLGPEVGQADGHPLYEPSATAALYGAGKGPPGLRFETLLWGGDEMRFVMPAWLGLGFARRFFEIVKDWRAPDGTPLTFAAGLVICNAKTPIRQVRTLLGEMADHAKAVGKPAKKSSQGAQARLPNLIEIEICESISPPAGDLAGYRKRLLGFDPERDVAADRLFALPGDELDRLLQAIASLKGEMDSEAFPRSKLYEFVRIAARSGFGSSSQQAGLEEAIERYLTRAGADRFSRNQLDILSEIGIEAPLSRSLALLAQLWDYAAPLGAGAPFEPKVQ
jgi:GNAT superfamily N-acetyltransferase